MLHNIDQQGVRVERYEEVRASATSLVGLSGVRFVESTYDIDFRLNRFQQKDFGRFLYESSCVRVAAWGHVDSGYESLRIEVSHYGVDEIGEHLLFGQKTYFTLMEGIVKYARQSSTYPFARQHIPEAAPVFDGHPQGVDFADWEYELRGEYDIGDESCQLLLCDIAEIASIE